MAVGAAWDMVFGLALLVLSGFPSLWLLMPLLRKLWAPDAAPLDARRETIARLEAAAVGVLRFAAVLGSIGAGFCLLGAVSAVAPLWVFLVLALWLLGCSRLLAMRRSGVILVCASGWTLLALQFCWAPAAFGDLWFSLIPPALLTMAAHLSWQRFRSERLGILVARWWQNRPAPYHRAAWKLGVLLTVGVLVNIPWLVPRLQPYWRAIYRGEGADLRGADLRCAPLRSGRLNGANLRGASLAGAILADASLPNAELQHVNLTNADLRKANLWHADLQGAVLRGAVLSKADLRTGDLRSADLVRANLFNAGLDNADLRRARLTGANLTRARLDRANLRGSELRHANLRRATLWGADLTDADLSSANLCGASFSLDPLKFPDWVTRLINTRLTNALYDKETRWPPGFDPKAYGAIGLLRGADLRGANLSDAQLNGMELQEIDLRGADLRGADLGHCDLRAVRLEGARLEGARYNEFTTWPEGFDPKRHGARFVRYWR